MKKTRIDLIALQVGDKFNRLNDPGEVLEMKHRQSSVGGYKVTVWNQKEQKVEELQFKRDAKVELHET